MSFKRREGIHENNPSTYYDKRGHYENLGSKHEKQ